jgi:integrase
LDFGRDENGKRIRQWHSGFATEKDAEQARTKLLYQVDRAEYVPPTRLTLRQFADDRWLPNLETAVAGGNLKPNTAASYRTQVNAYVKPRLGHLRLKDLTADMLAKFYGELLKSGRRTGKGKGGPLSPTSVHLAHVTVHRMLGDAVRWGLVARNVADAASKDAPKRRKTGKDTIRVWEPAQLGKFLESVKGDRLCALWVLLITTGVRRGEAVGLRWPDVDLEAGRLTVAQARVVVDHKVIESTPKSDSSGREISLDAATVSALRRHHTRQKEERMAWGPGRTETGLVFTREDGTGLHPNVISRTFARLAAAAELPPIRLHDLRHSYASAGLKAGVSIKVMQERLGHSSIAITGDIYSHVSRDVDQAAADKVAAVIFGTSS